MKTRSMSRMALSAILFALPLLAAPPVVKTVPWVPSDPLIPHDTYPGKTVTLKGTSDQSGAGVTYEWSFGDGTPNSIGNVTNGYAVEATHLYAGVPGTLYTATLTVRNGAAETGSATYLVIMRAKTLSVEANVAMDEGLWYLHKTMTRSGNTGNWTSGFAGSTYTANLAANITAFEVKGHRENGSSANPYTETVGRGMRQLFILLSSVSIPATQSNPTAANFTVDTNGNGYGVQVTQFDELYQGGQVMDAIIASGTPNAVTSTGTVGVAPNPGIFGRTYKSIVQDMLDYYSLCQSDGGSGGSWDYGCNQSQDNSVAQWAAIGLIPAEREWGLTIPAPIKNWNLTWLTNSKNPSGAFGYRSNSPLWGPYATTPSGMVQLAMDGKGRGDSRWDTAETLIRENFNATANDSFTNIKAYYYGLFSFTKSMLLHDSDGNGIPEPLTQLRSLAPVNPKPPIDWYSADPAIPDANNPIGVARKIVNDQSPGGYWTQRNTITGSQYTLETAWAIIMLNRTVVSAQPVAVPAGVPNPAIATQTVNFTGAASFHQDPAKTIVKWEWDLDNNGTYEIANVNAARSFPTTGSYTVWLRVTDNATPAQTAVASLTIVVSLPPIAPTADAGGPYSLCANRTPWFLDGSNSKNPDDGVSEPGAPGDKITAYDWDLDGDGQFDDASGAQPNVTAFFGSLIGQSKLISLRVTDNSALSFPSLAGPNLTGVDTAQVNVRAATDPACACVNNLAGRGRDKQVQLTWTKFNGAAKYNIYRSTVSGGPYVKIAETTSAYSTYLDKGLVNGTTYYYVVRPAAANGNETCQSNQASAKPIGL